MMVPQRAVKGSRGTEAGRPLLNEALQPNNLSANQAAISFAQGSGANLAGTMAAIGIIGLGGASGAGQYNSMTGDGSGPHGAFAKSANMTVGSRSSFVLAQTAVSGVLTRGILPPVAQGSLAHQGSQRKGQQDVPVCG